MFSLSLSPSLLKLEKTLAFRLTVTTKPSKQWQQLNLYGRFTQMAGDLRRWWVLTLTDRLVFSSQARLFIMHNKQGTMRALRFREDWVKEAATSLSWAVSWSQEQVVICLSLEHKGPDAASCSQAVVFSSAPGGQLFS